jgi:hypothetical protein
MGVSDLLHDHVILSLEKKPLVCIEQKADWASESIWTMKREKSPAPA